MKGTLVGAITWQTKIKMHTRTTNTGDPEFYCNLQHYVFLLKSYCRVLVFLVNYVQKVDGNYNVIDLLAVSINVDASWRGNQF